MDRSTASGTRRSARRMLTRTFGAFVVALVGLTSGLVSGASAQTSQNEVIVTRLFDGTAAFTAVNPDNPVDNGTAEPAPHTPGADSGATNNVVRTNDLYALRIDWDVNEANATDVVLKVTLPPLSSFKPDETGIFSGCDPTKSTITDQELLCWLGDEITQGSHGVIRPIADVKGDTKNNTTFNVTSTLLTAQDTTGVSDQLDTQLTVSEAPAGDWVKYPPTVRLLNDSSGNPAWYVMLYPIALIDYGQAAVPKKGAGQFATEKPIKFYDHTWKLADGTLWATPGDITAAGFLGTRMGPYAQGGALPITQGDWAVENVKTDATPYNVYEITATNYTNTIKASNADGSPNKAGVVLSGQLVLKMPYKQVLKEIEDDPINKANQGIQYYNTISSNGPDENLRPDGANLKPIIIEGTTPVPETTTNNNTSDTAISISETGPGGASGVAFYHMANIAPTATTKSQARIIDEGRAVDGIPRISTTDNGYFGSLYYDGRGEVTRGTPVDLEMFVSVSAPEKSTAKTTVPIHGCMTWDPQQLYVTPMHNLYDWYYNPNGSTYGETPPSGFLEDVRYGTSGGSWARGPYNRPTTYELPAALLKDIGLVVEYAYDPSVYTDNQTNGQAECNNTAARKWIPSTDTAALQEFRDPTVPFERYTFNMVRVRTKSFPWDRVYDNDPVTKPITSPLHHQTTAGIFLSVSAMVGIDKDINYTTKPVYVHSGRSSGWWNPTDDQPGVPVSDRPLDPKCYPDPTTDDVTLKPEITGWCSQPYSVLNESTNPEAISSLDISNFQTTSFPGWPQDPTKREIDSDTDRVTIVDVKPVVTKTVVNENDEVVPFKIADNDQEVEFKFVVEAVGARTEALTDVTFTDVLPRYYKFVAISQDPATKISDTEPACNFVPSTGPGDPQGSIQCRFSEEPGSGPVPANTTDLPEALPGFWRDEFKVKVLVQGGVANPKTYAPLSNTATIESQGFAPWDPTTGTFLTPTIPVTPLTQFDDSTAFSYMPFAGDFAISGKSIAESDTKCVLNLLPDELTFAEWQKRCATIPLDTDPSNTTATDDVGNIKFGLDYTNEGNTKLTNIAFVDVLPFNGDAVSEPPSSSGTFGADPSTVGDARRPASNFSGEVGFVSAVTDPDRPTPPDSPVYTTKVPVADIPSDPVLSWKTVPWCDGRRKVNQADGDCPQSPSEVTATFTSVPLLTDQYTTNAPPLTVPRDPLASWTTIPWCDATGAVVNGVAGTCPANPFEVTAVYMVINELYPDQSLTIDLTVDTEGASCTDDWTNTAGARNSYMFLPVRTNDVTAMVDCKYDLALQKRPGTTLDPLNDPSWATSGVTKIPFDIEVINQGDPVEGITVVDYVDTDVFSIDLADNPDGTTTAGTLGSTGTGPALAYSWSADDPAKPLVEITGKLAPGESVIVPVVLTLKKLPAGGLTNYSEITRFDNDGDATNGDSFTPNPDGFRLTDVDSIPDSINDEPFDGKLVDNVIDNSGGDEDDHDIAVVPWYDLALVKDLANGQKPILDTTANPVTVNYVIIVKNQGYLPVTDVEISDTPTTGFSYADTNPSGVVSIDSNIGPVDVDYEGVTGIVAKMKIARLAPGEELSIPITYVVDPATAAGGTYRNAAEISNFFDADGNKQPDVDSIPDDIPDNDAYTDPETPPERDGGESPDFLPPGYTDLHARNPLDEDDADFEFVSLPYSLGNQVWLDNNNNGLVDSGEPPIPGVTVELYADANADSEPDSTTPLQTTTTDADGWYLFSQLPSSSYVVVIPGSNFASGGPLFSMTSSVPTELVANDDVDNNDNGIVTPTDVRSSTVTLAGDEPTGEVPDNDPNADVLSNLTVDFGFFPVPFDLALRKTPAKDTPDFIVTGDEVTFDVTVFNQGDVNAADVVITDYLPEGLELIDPNWTNNGDGTATYKTPLTISAGATPQVIQITFLVTAAGTIDNYSEISVQRAVDDSGATITTPGGNPIVDIDSVPDTINGNDKLIDDAIDLTPATGDEDDHDIATIKTYPRFDLALRKTLAPGQSPEVKVGDTVPFAIEIFNQGDTYATDINLIDYIPAGLVFAPDNPGWTPSADGTTATIPLTDASGAPLVLAPGATTIATINLIANQSGYYDNFAEIYLQTAIDDKGTVLVGADGKTPLTDIDSTPDTINGNDKLIDNAIDLTPATGDEDDHDIAKVAIDVPIYDLALRKTPSADQPLVVERGDSAKFDIEIFNQGTLKVDEIQITDYIPEQLELDDPGWELAPDGKIATYRQPLSLDIGKTETITINFKVLKAGKIDNYSEISLGTPRAPDGSIAVDLKGEQLTDIDSVPDQINGNDVLVDNVIDNFGGDEDDHDIASLNAKEFVFDLALRKTTLEAADPLALGDIVTFQIEVFNQGEVPATDIDVVDYIPPQMAYVSQTGWTEPVDGKTTTKIDGPLNPGESTIVTIQLKVIQPGVKIDNYAEIFGALPTFDGGLTPALDSNGAVFTDIDSTPDEINGNDKLINDEINLTPATGDEDDHDIESVTVPVPSLDLALRKTPAPGQELNVRVGDQVTFTVTVFNQGTTAANNITLTDYIPTQLSLADGNWTNNGNGTASLLLPGTLPVGGTTAVTISFIVIQTGTINNYTEISTETAVGPDGQVIIGPNGPLTDIDSTPDTINGNDELINDEINLTPATGDEDDHDIATLTSIPYVFDLALRKTQAAGNPSPVGEGELVTFNIEVFNQGEVIARDINLVDYIPAQMELADTTWAQGAPQQATLVIPGPLNPGESVVVTITMRILLAEPIANHSEITSARPTDSAGNTLTTNTGAPIPDIDSTPDNILGNDAEINDRIDLTPETGDEDDEDIETLTPELPIYDLALRKLLTSATIANVGDLVTYSVEVFNQGEIEARDVTVTDYIPTGMVLADAAWTAGPNNTASRTIPGPILPGQSVVLTVTAQIVSADASTYVNITEITGSRPTRPDGKTVTDTNGNQVPDIDSVSDNNPNNDALIDNEINLRPPQDEDDHDIATVLINPVIPATGSDSMPIVRTALLALVAGLGMFAIGRRRRRRYVG